MDDTNKVTNLDEAREAGAGNATQPAATFGGTGGIQVAVWKRKSEGGLDNYSVRIDRTYKDNTEDKFKTTPYLRDSDLLRAGLLLQEADQWIEQDKGKRRSSGAERA